MKQVTLLIRQVITVDDEDMDQSYKEEAVETLNRVIEEGKVEICMEDVEVLSVVDDD